MNFYENIPAELKALRQWACTELPSKRPVQPNGKAASVSDQSTWHSFEECASASRYSAVCFIFTAADPYAVVDFDHVRNAETGETEPWVLARIEELSSYSEISISGTGWHVVVRGKLMETGNKAGRVEVYDHAKAMTLTGNTELFTGAEKIHDVDLSGLQSRLKTLDPKCPSRVVNTSTPVGNGNASEDDWKLIAEICKQTKPKNATELEAAFKAQYPERYAQRNAIKKNHSGKNYIAYTCERFMRLQPASGAAPSAIVVAKPPELNLPDMPEAVLDGWLGEICRTRMNEFPIAYAWPALLTAASVLMPPLPGKIRANLYSGIVGAVGTGKSSAYEHAFWLLNVSKPLLLNLKSGSSEGMAQKIGDVNGANRLVYVNELAHLLSKVNYEGATFEQFLNDAFYNDFHELTVAKRKEILFNCRLSIAGGIPEDKFDELFGAGVVGGLYDRFMLGICPSKFKVYSWHPPVGEPVLEPLSENESDNPFGVPQLLKRPQTISVETSIWDEKNRWQRELGLGARAAELGIRAAVICAAFDCREKLVVSDLDPALEFAKYQDRAHKSFQPNPGTNPDAKCAFQIKKWLETNAPNGEWMSRRTMYQMIHGNRLGPGVFDRAIKNMMFCEEIEIDKLGRQEVVRLRSVASELVSVGYTPEEKPCEV